MVNNFYGLAVKAGSIALQIFVLFFVDLIFSICRDIIGGFYYNILNSATCHCVCVCIYNVCPVFRVHMQSYPVEAIYYSSISAGTRPIIGICKCQLFIWSNLTVFLLLFCKNKSAKMISNDVKNVFITQTIIYEPNIAYALAGPLPSQLKYFTLSRITYV